MERGKRRWALWIVLAVAAAAALAPADASASGKKGIWGPVRVDGRSQFPIYRELGASVFHYRMGWRYQAPTRPARPRDPSDPAYQWPAELDDAIRQARRHRMQLAVLVHTVPGWANGGRGWNWRPNRIKDYADFMTAAAKRYPGVRYWVVWGEPTQAYNFSPLIREKSTTRPLDRRRRDAPRYYARLLDATYGALKRVNRRIIVVGGNSFTFGDISPLNWIRALKLPNGRKPRMDMYGHNPFQMARRPRLSDDPNMPGTADMSDLDSLARWLDRYYGRGPNGKPLRIFIGEWFVPTDHYSRELNWYVMRPLQAEWIADALRLFRRFPRAAVFNYFALYDDPPLPSGDEVNRGLIDIDGNRKPAFRAFARG